MSKHRRQQTEGDTDCTLKWCGGDCVKGDYGQPSGTGKPVCSGSGLVCSQIPLGCELCSPPLIEPSSDGLVKLEATSDPALLPGLEAGMKVSLELSINADISTSPDDIYSTCRGQLSFECRVLVYYFVRLTDNDLLLEPP